MKMAVDPHYLLHQQRKRNLRDFNRHTKLLLTPSERDSLHSVLKEYQVHRQVALLCQELQSLLDTPSKLDLLKDVRAFIPRSHLAQFDHLVPYHKMAHPLTVRNAVSHPNLSVVVSSGGNTHGHVATPGASPHIHIQPSTGGSHGPVFHPATHHGAHQRVLAVAGTSTSLPRPKKHHHGNVPSGSLTVPRPPKPRPTVYDGVAEPGMMSPLLLHTVTLTKDPHEGLGFSIRGGSEHGLGIYVSELEPDSPAEHAGLRLGDNVVEVNNITFENVSSSSAVKVLTGSRRLKMMIRRVGKIPGFKFAREKTSWYDVSLNRIVEGSFEDHGTFHSPVGLSYVDEVMERRIHIIITQEDQYLGFNIRGGSEYGLGIYVSRVDPGGLAEQMGLKVGDQAMEVNGINFENITHANAVDMMRSHTKLIMTVRDVGKYPAYKEIYAEYSWIDATTGTISKSRSGYITSVPVRPPSPESTSKSFTEYPLDSRVESYAQTDYNYLDPETGRHTAGVQTDSDDDLPDRLPGEPDTEYVVNDMQKGYPRRSGHSRSDANSHVLLPKNSDVVMMERPNRDSEGSLKEPKKPTKKDTRSPKSSLGVKAMQREQRRYMQTEVENSNRANNYKSLPNGYAERPQTVQYQENLQKEAKLARSDGDLLHSQREENAWHVDREDRTHSLKLDNSREGEPLPPPLPLPREREGSINGQEDQGKKEKKSRGKPLRRVQSLKKPGEIDPRQLSEDALAENSDRKVKRTRTFKEILFGTKSRGHKMKTDSTGPSATKTKSRKSLSNISFSLKRSKDTDSLKSQTNTNVNGKSGEGSSGDSMLSAGSSSQVIHQEAPISNPDLATIHNNAHRLLNEDEAQAIVRHVSQYKRQQNVETLMTPVLAILDTPEKNELLHDIRNVIEPTDLGRFEQLVSPQDHDLHRERYGKSNTRNHDPHDHKSQNSFENGHHLNKLQLPSRNGTGSDPLTYSRLGLEKDDREIVVPASAEDVHSMEIHRPRSSSKVYKALTGGEAWELSSLHTTPEHESQDVRSSPSRSKSADDILRVEISHPHTSGNRNSSEFSYRSGRSSPVSDISSAYSGISGRYSINKDGRDYHDVEPVYASLDDTKDAGEIKFLGSRNLNHSYTKVSPRALTASSSHGTPNRSVGNALVFLDMNVVGNQDDDKSISSDAVDAASGAFGFLDSLEDTSEDSNKNKHPSPRMEKDSPARNNSERYRSYEVTHKRNPPSRSNSKNKHGNRPMFVAPPPPATPPPGQHDEDAWQEWVTEDITPEMLRQSSGRASGSPHDSTPYASAREELSPESSPPRERLIFGEESSKMSPSYHSMPNSTRELRQHTGSTVNSPRDSVSSKDHMSLRGRSPSPSSRHENMSLHGRSPSPSPRREKTSVRGRSPTPSPRRSKMSMRDRSPSPASTVDRISVNEGSPSSQSPRYETSSKKVNPVGQRTTESEEHSPLNSGHDTKLQSERSHSPFSRASKLSFRGRSPSPNSREDRVSLRNRSPSPNGRDRSSSDRASYPSQKTKTPPPTYDRVSVGRNGSSRDPSPQRSYRESPRSNPSSSGSYNDSLRSNPSPSRSYPETFRSKSPSPRQQSSQRDSLNSSRSHSQDKVSLRDVSIASFMEDSVDKDSLSNVMAPLSRSSTPQRDNQPITVHLKKERPSLGISISGGSNSRKQPHVHIQNVFPQGAAADEGTIQPGMRLLYVGGHSLEGVSHAQAVEIIRKSYSNKHSSELELVVLPQRYNHNN